MENNPEIDEEVLLLNVQDDLTDDKTDDENKSDEDDEDSTQLQKKKRFITKMPPHVKGLMGEANLRLARGELELAKKMCFEVIRQAPNAYEPYLTLAQMYENTNIKKYKGFLMLAAHLQPSNAEIWCRLADVELEENQLKEALDCYNRAIKAQPDDMALHLKRLKLIEQRVPEKSRGYSIYRFKLLMAKCLPKSKHGEIMELCSEVAKGYFDKKHYARAIEALKIPIMKVPKKITQDILNMLLELLLLNERYSECLDVFTQFCGFSFDVTIDENMTISINSYTIPENLHLDLKSKFIVCMIRLQAYHLIDYLIQDMIEKDNVEENGTLYFDIVEALMASAYYKEALQLLLLLVKSKNYSLAAIWLRHAECLTHLEMFDQAIDAYYTVIKLAPNHVEALYPLAMLLLKQDRKKEALQVLSQDLSTGKLHVAVLIEQMKLLKQIGDVENYWKCCELLLSRHCIIFKNYEELKVAKYRDKRVKIAKIRTLKGEDADLNFHLESIFEPAPEDEYHLYREILQFAFDQREYLQFQKFAFMGLTSKKFSSNFSEIFLVSCFSCLFSKDYYNGYLMAKEILIQHPGNNQAWNFYSFLVQKTDEPHKLTRFFEGASIKNKMPAGNTALVKANYLCSVAHYPECLNHFLKEYKNNGDSYSALMIAICMLNQYCQKHLQKISKKTMLETITYLFLNYAKIRTKHAEQETYYNLGRMYQQVGIFHLAEFYYKKVFKVENEYLEKYPDILDLKQEAAYNLHLIYKSSGNLIAAKNILWEHIVM